MVAAAIPVAVVMVVVEVSIAAETEGAEWVVDGSVRG